MISEKHEVAMGMPDSFRAHGKRYYSLDSYLKDTFGEKVYRISLNGGMTCPNRDGTLDTRGCIFCSKGGSGDFAEDVKLTITEQIEAGKLRLRNKTNCRKYIAYFQAYTNTYAPLDTLRQLFTEAISHPDVVILSIATRPDCLNAEIIELLTELQCIKPVWIELGLQTIHDDTATLIRRKFSLSCYEHAVELCRQACIPVITHVILGLPGETKEDMLTTVDYVAHSSAAGIKLQLLHILEDTDLAIYYQNHPFPLFSLDSYCDFIAECLEHLPDNMVVHRITGDAPKRLLVAPKWSGDKKRVLNTIQKRLRERDSWQGKKFQPDILPVFDRTEQFYG